MSLIKCPECGKEISDKAAVCPSCGNPINIIQKKQGKSNAGKVCIIIGIISLVFDFFYAVSGSEKLLMEEAFRISHGYYSSAYPFFYNLITNGLAFVGVVLIIIGIVIAIVNRKK